MACIPRSSSRMEMITMDVSSREITNNVLDNYNNEELEDANISENADSSSSLKKEIYSLLISCQKLLCYSIKIISENFDNIYGNFLHIYFIIVFEILFYFNYIIHIEYKEIQRVLKSFSNDMKHYFGNIIDLLPGNNKNEILEELCNEIKTKYVSKNNTELQQSAYNIIWILSIFLIIFTIMHYFIVKDLKKMFSKSREAFLFIGFIAIFEYYFFTGIVTKYNVMTSEEASCLLYQELIK
tara:strand:- start:2006 stop:2725 length:720 start_codon:yes stop_codon:yes gene_type:complete